MAAVTLSHNITRQEDFEGTPGGTIGSTGGGPGASAAAGLNYQASQALQRRIGSANSNHGFDYAHDDIGTVNMRNSGFHVWLAKVYSTILDINPAGIEIGIGDADGSMYRVQVGDDGTMGDNADFAAPAAGGYIFAPFEARVNAWHSEGREATPDITVADTVEVIYNVGTTTGAGDSAAMDSIDYTSDGLFLVGGDGANADGVFQDFVTADEGGGLTGADRAGLWRRVGTQFIAYLTNVIGRTDTGTVTATVFTDSGFNVVFPGGFVSDGRNGLEFDLGNANTVITLSDGTIGGNTRSQGGRSKIKRYFDTELDVSGGLADSITMTGHPFRTGDAVIYSAEGGTEDIGPDATNGEAEFNNATAGAVGTGPYWYVVNSGPNVIQLSATPSGAFAQTPGITNLTPSASGNGENHSLERAPDTRPNITFTGTAGSATFTRVNLPNCRIITLRSPVTLDSCVLTGCRQIILNDGTLSSCINTAMTTSIGEAYVQAIHAQDLDRLDDSRFTSGGQGHFAEVTTLGTGAQTTGQLDNVQLSGYFTGDTDNTGGVSFDPDTTGNGGDIDLTADTITITGHPFSDGDPVYYSDESGTAITGLTDQALYYVNSIDANTIALHPSRTAAINNANRANMTAASTDATHKLYSANAAIFNDTGGAITINVVNGGSTPSVRNSAGATTTVNNNVALTFSPLELNTEVRLLNTGTNNELDGVENSGASFVASIPANTAIDYIIIKPGFLDIRVENVQFATSQTVLVNQQIDRNFDRVD